MAKRKAAAKRELISMAPTSDSSTEAQKVSSRNQTTLAVQ